VTAMFAHAEHGISNTKRCPSGTRVSTRNSDGYFVMMRELHRSGRCGHITARV